MGYTVIGISDMRVSSDAEDILITYSLGSCIGLTLYDPTIGVGGMVHCMLPHSKTDESKAQQNPCMYVDSGVLALLGALFDLGAQRKNIIANIAGGSNLLDEKEVFKIGERNYTMVRKVLWKNDIIPRGVEVGGTIPRTMLLYLNDGRTVIKSGGAERDL